MTITIHFYPRRSPKRKMAETFDNKATADKWVQLLKANDYRIESVVENRKVTK